MVIELVELYNFALMNFDLEGQGQGQIGKKTFFRLKSRLGARQMLFCPQFLMESHNISHNGRPLVGAYRVYTEI